MLNNFIYAKQKSLFEKALNNGEVLDEAIVFIEDTKEIWNHGTYFDGNAVDLSDVEKSIQDILDNIPTKVSDLENDSGFITLADVPDLSGYATKTDLNGKVDRIDGKQLSTEDFTTLLKQKLEGLSNYDDTTISNAISGLQSQINTLVSGNASTAIDSFNEIIAFLNGIEDSQSLDSIIASIEQQIAGKMDKVTLAAVATSGSYNDLSNKPTIPDAVTESTVSGWGFTKNTGTYSKPSTGIPKSDLASAVQTSLGKADTALQSYTEQYKGTITGVSANGTSVATSGVANIPAASTSAYGVTKLSSSTSSTSTTLAATASAVKAAYDLANGKQAKLVSGTNIKTINGESVLGEGNIVINSSSSEETTIDDGVYAVTADEKLIDYNEADDSCIGVALVAGEHKFIIAKSDATNDGSNYNLYWTNNTSDLSLTNYTTSDGTNLDGYLPKPDGTFGSSTHLSDDFTTWTNGALSDFNGKANTAVVAAASSHAKDMCTVLNTFNASDSFKDWYVPACGQLALMYLNMTEINAALAKIGGTALAAGSYWSSSEGSSYIAWRVNFGNGYVYSGDKDDGRGIRVRFVRDISVKSLKERVSELESNKQDKLVSGTNIKTINNQSVLGSGNITISGGGSSEPYVLDIPSLVSSFGGLPDDMGNVQCYGTVTSQKMSEIITAANNNNLVIKNEYFQYHNYDIQDRFDEDDEIVDINVNGNPCINEVGYAPCSEIISISLNVTTSEAYLSCSYSPISGKFIKYEDDASFLILMPNTYHIVTDESPTDIYVYLLFSFIPHFMEEYFVEFTTSSSGTTVSLPSTIKWADGEIPIFEPSTTYQISIVNNLGVVQKFK